MAKPPVNIPAGMLIDLGYGFVIAGLGEMSVLGVLHGLARSPVFQGRPEGFLTEFHLPKESMSKDEGTPERTRTVTWVDPNANARDATQISGYEFLNSIREGRIPAPPLAKLLGYHMVELDTGRAVFEIEPAEYHYNPFASVHGGIASTLLDTAMTSAILTTLAVGLSCTTLEMKVNFIRPLTDRTGPVRSEGRVIHVGKRIATAEGKLLDRDNKLYAHGVTTCIVFPVRREG